jgi:hypothetical protein
VCCVNRKLMNGRKITEKQINARKKIQNNGEMGMPAA